MSPKPVFISHSSLDKDTADKLCRLLEDRGISCWIAPRNVPPGAKYGEAIVHAIEEASAMILIFSAHSNSSDQVMNEVERAVSKKKRIFPLKIKNVTPSTELEYFISRRHWLDASTESLEACAEQLVAAIRQPEVTSAQAVPQQIPSRLPATRKKTIIFGIGIILALFVIFAVLFSDQVWRKSARDENAIHQQKDLAGTNTGEDGLVEKKEKTEEPLKPYQQTILLKPDEPTTKRLLQIEEERQQLALDREKQAYTESLMSKLVQIHRTKKHRPGAGDGWTSTPLTLSILNFQLQETMASREGEAEFILMKLVDALQTTGRIDVVDREKLNSQIAEMKLSATDLTDPQTALRVGRILGARLIAIGQFARFGDEGQLIMQVLETESTRTMAAVAEIVENPQQIDKAVNQLAGKLLPKLQAAYPLQARIAQITPKGVILNIGTAQGMIPGLTMQVFGKEEQITLDGKVLDSLGNPVGLIEVTRVEKKICHARVVEQTETFVKGCKVREVAQL